MAIGLRLRHQRGTDVAATAAAVLDDEGWPHFACNLSPTMRASTSLVPPPGYGTRNFTGLVGYPSCPNALFAPGGGTIDRMKMKAKAANHRTMGISRPRMSKDVQEYR